MVVESDGYIALIEYLVESLGLFESQQQGSGTQPAAERRGCRASTRSGRVLSTVFRRKKNGNPKIAGRNVFDAI